MPQTQPYRHQLVVEVVSEVDRGQRQMQARLHRWIERYGHTASSFGFEFRTVGVLTGKFVRPKKKMQRKRSIDERDLADSMHAGAGR